jgi:predicted ferric reductase
MDASIWACCGVLGAFIAYYPLSCMLSRAYPKFVAFLRRYIFNPPIPRTLRLGSIRGRKLSVNIRGTGVVTPLYLILATTVLILNVVVLALSLKSRNVLIWRSGRVLAVDLCIMIVSGRQSLFSESFGISYEFQAFFHRWLGRVVFLVGIIHAMIALVPYQTGGTILSPVPRIAGFTVCGSFFLRFILLMANGRRLHRPSLLLYCLHSLLYVKRFMKYSAAFIISPQLLSL